MKKITILIAMIMIGTIAKTQSIWFEQDVRIPENEKAVFFTQLQYSHPLWGESGLSGAAYIATDYSWHETLCFINYQQDIFSGGIGAGIEIQANKVGFRVSPWVKAEPMIYEAESGRLEIASLWEFGTGKGNYWYSNSIIYKARTEEEMGGQLGILYRRFYGIGPIIGFSWRNKTRWTPRNSDISISINLGILRDFENDRVNITPMATITF